MGGPGQIKLPSFGVLGEKQNAKMPSFGVMRERPTTGKNGLLNKLLTIGRVMPSGTHVKMTPFGMMPASMGDVMDHNKKRMDRLHAFATGTGLVGQQNLKRIFGPTPASTVS
jgi:hypothetical protein